MKEEKYERNETRGKWQLDSRFATTLGLRQVDIAPLQKRKLVE